MKQYSEGDWVLQIGVEGNIYINYVGPSFVVFMTDSSSCLLIPLKFFSKKLQNDKKEGDIVIYLNKNVDLVNCINQLFCPSLNWIQMVDRVSKYEYPTWTRILHL